MHKVHFVFIKIDHTDHRGCLNIELKNDNRLLSMRSLTLSCFATTANDKAK